MNEVQFTKKDVRDYLMANPEAEHVIGRVGRCVLSNFYFAQEGIRYHVVPRIGRRNCLDAQPTYEPLPAWAEDVIREFDAMGDYSDLVQSWEVLAELDPLLKDDPEPIPPSDPRIAEFTEGIGRGARQ